MVLTDVVPTSLVLGALKRLTCLPVGKSTHHPQSGTLLHLAKSLEVKIELTPSRSIPSAVAIIQSILETQCTRHSVSVNLPLSRADLPLKPRKRSSDAPSLSQPATPTNLRPALIWPVLRPATRQRLLVLAANPLSAWTIVTRRC